MTVNERLTVPICPPEIHLQAILESSADAIVLLDPEGTIREWNEAATRILGLEAHEVLGRNASTLESNATVGDLFRSSYPAEGATIRRARDGKSVPVMVVTRALFDGEGRSMGTLKMVREVSNATQTEGAVEDREWALRHALRALRKSHEELKSTQLQLIQAAKLESIGRLAAGVAHEVKNPLAVILAGLQLLRKRLKDPDTMTLETFEDVEAAVKRANGVTMGLLNFAVSTQLSVELASLEDVVTSAVRLVQHEVTRRGINLEREQLAVIPRLRLDPTKIEQVIVNLIMNAVDAMPEKGTVTVRTSMRQLTQPGMGIGFRSSDVLRVGQTVAVVEVDDTGTGIPPEVLTRLFNPFFTTKPAGKGVGLGLAVCRTIVNLHHGSIWLENRPEGGTRATVLIRAGEDQKGVNS